MMEVWHSPHSQGLDFIGGKGWGRHAEKSALDQSSFIPNSFSCEFSTLFLEHQVPNKSYTLWKERAHSRVHYPERQKKVIILCWIHKLLNVECNMSV
jgi:hypothetical protein